MDEIRGLKRYKFPVIKKLRDENYSTGNIVHNIVITLYGHRW